MKTLKSILLSVAIIFATIAPFALVGYRGGRGGGGGSRVSYHRGGFSRGGVGFGLGAAGFGLGVGIGRRHGYYGPWGYRWNRPAWYYDSYWGPEFPIFSVGLSNSDLTIRNYNALKTAYKNLQDRTTTLETSLEEQSRIINTQSDQIDRLTEKLDQATSKTEKSSLANQLKEEQAKLLEAQQERKDLEKKLSVTKKDIKKLDQTAQDKLGTPPAADEDEE
ncbi:MAG: hypothetical protein UV38_C0001G0214 [candidate division TM6 bacterium GW2011_GWE2_42_60]|nr:MAG: hypothetical protein UV38_C0001G0214 [candidate division TM6 bacterium GW2011_GWE2_42_60]HBY05592.1 hypothetical protein [Candidatus Dependentiae bacterium]